MSESVHHENRRSRGERIARRAYEKWATRRLGRPSALQDWLDAEAEVRQLSQLEEKLAHTTAELALRLTRQRHTKRRLRVEHSISRILATSLSLGDVGVPILEVICKVLRCNQGRLSTCIESPDVMQVVAAWPEPDFQLAQGALVRPFEPTEVASTAISFPIRAESGLLGALEFRYVDQAVIPQAAISMLVRICDQVAGFVERLRLQKQLADHDDDRRVAGLIQQSLLPRNPPTIPGVSLCGKIMAVEGVGGDYFDFFEMPGDGRVDLGIVIADASGHGIASALMMSQARAFLRAVSLERGDVESLLGLSNSGLLGDVESGHFVTLLMMKIDPRAGVLTFANAGHWPGYVFDWQGRQKAVLNSTGPPLGISAGSRIGAGPPVSLEKGDLIFSFTDGIIEAAEPDGTLFGVERALEIVRANRHQRPQQILDELFDEVLDFCGNRPVDDLTGVAIKIDDTGNLISSDAVQLQKLGRHSESSRCQPDVRP